VRSDLDEAREIAERGSMKLHQIDILLYRARLFGGPRLTTCGGWYPRQSAAADLVLVRTLIEKHGYLRLKEELEDAEGALQQAGE
jgi:hypothetical protein